VDFTAPLPAQLAELDRRLDELSARGLDVIAISAETRERTEQLQAGSKLERLAIAYGLTEPSMREWGLFASRGTERRRTGALQRAGLFLIEPDGKVYYESILSMPAVRPGSTTCSRHRLLDAGRLSRSR
jgi:alkyl hydroperoxide reductase subunit AhpC